MVLEIPLAAITVATAVKDIVEVGQKIRGSFAKVSNNFDSAKRMLKDINEMVEEVEVFYEDHKDALDGMKDFDVALQALRGKFRNFETSVLPFLPQTGGGKRVQFIRGWDAWRDNNKIERSISDLQTDILRVMRRYVWKSTLRAEVNLENIRQETSRGLTGITQGLAILEDVRRDVSAIRVTATATATRGLYDSSGTTTDEFARNIIMFAQSTPSTSAPILRTPDAISEEVMTSGYIKFQIHSIAMSLEKMTISPIPTSNNIAPTITTSTGVIKFQINLELEQGAMSVGRLRHWVVRQVTIIRDLLDTQRAGTISADEGATALSDLMIGLQALNMSHECVLVGNWAIMLARSRITESDGDDNIDPYASLALYLLNQSIQYHCIDDNVQSLQTIMEAYTITQSLYEESRGDTDIEILHSSVLLQHSELVDAQRSIEMLVEAIQVLENILNVDIFTLLESLNTVDVEQIEQASPSFVDGLFHTTPPPTAATKYARALQRLGLRSLTAGHPDLALGLELLAIAVRRKMVSMHGDEHKADLAKSLSYLVQGEIANQIRGEDLIKMADESVHIFRDLADKNPVYYARQLVSVLETKASTLEKLNRDTEAIATWEEVASLAGQLVQDSEMHATALRTLSDNFRRLKRYDDAARTEVLAINTHQHGEEIQAMQYFDLSTDLQQLQRYQESAQAARTSVGLYRRLAMREAGPSLSLLTEGLSNLAQSLAASGDYSGASLAWRESMSILKNFFMNHDWDPSSNESILYLLALDRFQSLSHILNDEEDCLRVNSTACQYISHVTKADPQNSDIIQCLLHAELCYVYTMLRVGRLQEADQYIDHWVDIWGEGRMAIPESDLMSARSTMMVLKGHVLCSQGRTEEALLAARMVHATVPIASTDSQPLYRHMIDPMLLEAQIQVYLGSAEQGRQVAEQALRLSRNQGIDSDLGNVMCSLATVAFTSLSCYDYKAAFKAAQEGCDILITPVGSEYWKNNEYGSSVCPSLFSMLASAQAHLGRYSTALENAHRAVDLSLDIAKMKLYVSATTAELSYMETRGVLAEILIATGDLAQVRQICEERRTYYIKRVEKRMGDYADLAPVLRMLGILCCAEGRHKEGNDAAQELSRIVEMLGRAFPSLQMQVKRRLRHQVKVPALESLNDMSQKLECGHHARFVSLFEGVEDD